MKERPDPEKNKPKLKQVAGIEGDLRMENRLYLSYLSL